MRSLLFLALAGCPWIDAKELSDRVDADGDGVEATSVGGADCDDNDPEVGPDRPERCNGIDDNCDGAIDEGAGDAVVGGTVFYVDADLDTFGSTNEAVTACIRPEGYAERADDCDDTQDDVFPGASERCNGIDDDCNGATDDDAVDAPLWYADTDADDYGDPTAVTAACESVLNHVLNGDDCDDSDPAIHPETQWFTDADGDGYGNPSLFVTQACVGPLDAAPNNGDCDDTDDTLNPDTPWFLDLDGDDYGDAATEENACLRPAGPYVREAGDCDDSDAALNPEAVWFTDADGDGFTGTALVACAPPTGATAAPEDCDDTDEDISPAAAERCDPNHVDEDCDGAADDDDLGPDPIGAVPWYEDFDNDGWGIDTPTYFCEPPQWPLEFADRPGDCDDTRPAVNPETSWYPDADGDSFADDTATPIVQCDAPPGHYQVRPGDDVDCNDTDDAIFPGAEEFCDAVDSDCDGDLIDPDSLEERTWYRDTDGDGWGRETQTTMSCAQPDGYSAVFGDCNTSDPLTYPGAPDACYDNLDRNCDGDQEDDCDGDGFLRFEDGGEDCDDLDPTVSPLLPTTRSVPTDHATLQLAVDAACPGDWILVEPGTHVGTATAAREVHIEGAGVGLTVLDGAGEGPLISLLDGGSVRAATLTDGVATYGGCLYARGGQHVEFVDLTLDTCVAESTGGGIDIQGGSFAIEGVDMQSCESLGSGGGLNVSAANGHLTNVSCTDCAASSGGAVMLVFTDTDIDGLTLTRAQGLASVFLGSSIGGTWTDITFDRTESLNPGFTLVGAGGVGPLIIDGVLLIEPASSTGGTFALWSGSTTDLAVSNLRQTGSEVSGSLFVLPSSINISVTGGSAVLSNIELIGGGATRLSTALSSGSILFEHGTIARTLDGLVLDASDPGAIVLRNTVVSDTIGNGLRIDGALPVIEGTNLFGNPDGDWPVGPTYVGLDGNTAVDPGWLSYGPALASDAVDLRLGPASALRDAGIGLDLDGSQADVGAYGGLGVSPQAVDDLDNDGMYDTWEIRFGLDPAVDSTGGDPDGDGLLNIDEYAAGTFPDTADTDGDGIDDATEVSGATDPLDANSP